MADSLGTDDPLAAHLASLAEPALVRLARVILGGMPTARSMAERAIAQRLTDPIWLDELLGRLGAAPRAALRSLARAGVPVARADAIAMSSAAGTDVVEELEANGLLVPVKTGPGMPTHVAVTPGLFEVLRSLESENAAPVSLSGREYATARRRFELAMLLGALAQATPRLTREGRLHSADRAALEERLGALLPAREIERRLQRLLDIGAVGRLEQRIFVPDATLDRFDETWLRLALSDLAAPSVPEGTLGIVSRLAEPDATMPIRLALESVRAVLLRDRADEGEEPRRGARRELADTLGTLLHIEGVLVFDAAGGAVATVGDGLLERMAEGDSLQLALDPTLSAVLRGDAAPVLRSTQGHVQSSFEIVADAGCEAGLLARIGAWSRLERADVAAVFRIEKKSVLAAASAGRLDALVSALQSLSGRPVPQNVLHNVAEWAAESASATPDFECSTPREIDALRDEALAAIRSAPPI